MRETGCDAVMLGFESGNQKMLDAMNKKTDIRKMKEGHALLKKFNITTIGYFFIGFPGETNDTVLDIVRFIEEVSPDFYFVRPWFCDVTTEIVQQKNKYGIEGMNYEWKHNSMDFTTAERIGNFHTKFKILFIKALLQRIFLI